MTLPDEIVRREIYEGWKTFLVNLEKALESIEKEVDNTSKNLDTCTQEWCQATEYALDEVSNSLFSISEPSLSSKEDTQKLKALKRRVHDIYAKYKSTANQAS
jgi:hypothetical protein